MAKLLSTLELDGLTELCPMVAHMVDNPLSRKLPFMRRTISIFRLCARPRQSSQRLLLDMCHQKESQATHNVTSQSNE